ncbi:MAG: class I SAM-dependent methyltransferase [Actinomycetota bacterium]
MSAGSSLAAPPVAELLGRLHAAAEAQWPDVAPHMALLGEGAEGTDLWPHHMRDFYLPVSPAQGVFLYQTVRATGARRVIEFGSSFGVSTIYLAAGVHDNGGGIVVGSELVATKAEQAMANLTAAGLADVAEIRAGDARATLADPGGVVDMVLLDGGPSLYVDVLAGLVPWLRPGAVVIADNVEEPTGDGPSYAGWIRNEANGFVSSSVAFKDGTEYSVWVGRSDT